MDFQLICCDHKKPHHGTIYRMRLLHIHRNCHIIIHTFRNIFMQQRVLMPNQWETTQILKWLSMMEFSTTLILLIFSSLARYSIPPIACLYATNWPIPEYDLVVLCRVHNFLFDFAILLFPPCHGLSSQFNRSFGDFISCAHSHINLCVWSCWKWCINERFLSKSIQAHTLAAVRPSVRCLG